MLKTPCPLALLAEVLNEFSGLIWTLHRQHPVLAAFQFVIVHEELFQFTLKLFPQIFDSLDLRPSVRTLLDREAAESPESECPE